MRAAKLGRVHSEETKAKMRASMKGRISAPGNLIPVVCVESSRVYKSMTEAAKSLGVSRGAVSGAIGRNGRIKGRKFVVMKDYRPTETVHALKIDGGSDVS